MSSEGADRRKRLDRFLISVLHDDSKISSARQGQLFIEAVCAQDDTALLVDKLSSSPKGLQCLQRCVRQDLSLDFVNGPASQLLSKIADPSIAAIDSGSVLRTILQHLIQPSFFWSACLKYLKLRELNPDATHRVAWLLAEILRLFPTESIGPYLSPATQAEVVEAIIASNSVEARSYGYLIKHRMTLRDSGNEHNEDGKGPGGRHDNDEKNIRDIKILPTRDEIMSAQPPFLRTAAEVFGCREPEDRCHPYIDHMFRILREDMNHDLKEKWQETSSGKPSRRGFIVVSTLLSDIECDNIQETKPWRRQPWAVCFKSPNPLPGLEKLSPKDREALLNNHRSSGHKILRHGSLVAICLRGEAVGFGYVNRVVDRLSRDSTEIVLRLDNGSASYILDIALSGAQFDLRQIDTATFAYEPFLKKLQQLKSMEFCNLILGSGQNVEMAETNRRVERIIEGISSNEEDILRDLLPKSKDLKLDESQKAALLSGISKRISIIQGPPGTGKSFIGALIAQILHENLEGSIMVICFTNHALDQFTEDIMDIGIPEWSIVRLGSKSSPRTESLLLRNQKRTSRLAPREWSNLNEVGNEMVELEGAMKRSFRNLHVPVSVKEIMEHLEFIDDDKFYRALTVPNEDDGMVTVSKKGRVAGPGFLLSRWLKGGTDAGVFSHVAAINSNPVWQLSQDQRRSMYDGWQRDIRHQHLDDLKHSGKLYNHLQETSNDVFRSQDAKILSSKRIIACTSTCAAMSSDLLSRVRPKTVLLEEAGELLEPHVLTAISDCTERLIMIGDHKQLRPKVANYSLSVEAGNGYDLNRSLFERLILRGFPHVTLSKQHRMRPEISGIVRHLTYPNLEDAASTLARPPIRGLQQNVIFVDHREPEVVLDRVIERQSGTSKQNPHEALLALRYVRYLAQQGYGSDDIVVLTPYLGQLRLLQETLSKENDPILNDLDTHDLYRAGLLSSQNTNPKGRQVHLSSIDNYQGEEKKIVIISLTRSNSIGAIGFMSQPERLNVLLSRARDGMIVIGNLSTFTSSKNGCELWTKLRTYVMERGFLYPGLPTQCQSHPAVKNIVVKSEDFLALCPDGGCSQPCPEILACGLHKCSSRCHILMDHSKTACSEVVSSTCPRGHKRSWRCQSKPVTGCVTCDKLDEKLKRTAQAKLDQIEADEADQQRHDMEMEAIDNEISLIRQEMANKQLNKDRTKALVAKKKSLQQTQLQLQKAKDNENVSGNSTSKAQPADTNTDPQASLKIHKTQRDQADSTPDPGPPLYLDEMSEAQQEWARQKKVDGQSNEAIDELMAMIGLEQVKQHVLDLKNQIEIKKRQNVNLAGERFHVTFLGNPGTGKTTVARLWAKLLYSLDVIPGDAIEETTGSKLATYGVQQAKKHIDDILNANGGVMFVDEAYQLTNGTSAGGKQVLDFLLGEIENRRGKIVFVFAGYRQPMETFLSHNPGIPSRIPHSFDFVDYSEKELLTMLQNLFQKRFDDKAKIENGPTGLYMRIVARRLSRRRDMEGFGNMRDLENIFNRISARQAHRIGKERRQGTVTDDFIFEKEDLIGPEPSTAMLQSPAYSKLQSLIGLEMVKDSILNMFSMMATNYTRELEEKEPVLMSLNKVFLGSPGTGKTSVAKLYGRLLADTGLLSNGDVVAKVPADFIGAVLGASEQNTNSILESAKGKVLIIDEAYMLDPASADRGGYSADPFRKAVIDTIVSKVHNAVGDDRCVLLLGYENQMESMFQNANPGLGRRFPLTDAFRFEDFNDEDLRRILRMKLASQDLVATAEGEETAIGLLSRERNLRNFGNAGAVENLISKAKNNRQKRVKAGIDGSFELEPIDFDLDHARAASAGVRLADLFKDTIGLEGLVSQLSEYQTIASNVKAAGLRVQDHIPFNFIFKGPPGTGKTSTARKIGQVFYDMGLLDRAEVVECSVSNLVGEYVGHTGPKVMKLLEKCLGKVLFVDEAYRLRDGHFAAEAVSELVDVLTKPEFKSKLIVILAGYEDEMDSLMSVNPGLASRFPEVVIFKSLSPSQCMDLFSKQLLQNGLRCSSFDDSQSLLAKELVEVFEQLVRLRFWGNGRDVQNISKKAMRYAFGQQRHSGDDMSEIPHQHVLDCLKQELRERMKTEGQVNKNVSPVSNSVSPPSLAMRNLKSGPPSSTINNPAIAQPKPATKPNTEIDEHSEEQATDSRDPGVSDAIWTQLQSDAAAVAEKERHDAATREMLAAKADSATRAYEEADCDLKRCKITTVTRNDKSSLSDDDSDSDDGSAVEARRLSLLKYEAARLRHVKALQERERIDQHIAAEKAKQQKAKRQEEMVQTKLLQMGVCVAGYQWIKQDSGYRCAGGTHFVSNSHLGDQTSS